MRLGTFVARMSQRVPPPAGPMTGSAISGVSLAYVPRGTSDPGYRCAHPGYDTAR
jgi:hypothetical protein